MYKHFKVDIAIHTLVMHSAQSADPLNTYAKAMKVISGKRNKTEADHKALAELEFEAGLYLNPQQEVILPGRVFEAAIAVGARKTKEGKVALATMFVDNDAVIQYDGGPMTLGQLKASPDHRLVVPVKVKQAKIMRTRPIFRNVRASFVVSLDTAEANPSQLKTWIENTVNQVGLCDWRPRHGRGTLVGFEEVKSPVTRVA